MSWSPSFCRCAARVGLLAALFALAGCVSSRSFMPAEHVTAVSPGGGHYASEYPIEEGGTTVGDVKVWSPGAARDASDAEPHTTVRVGFEVTSHDGETLRLDRDRLYLEEMPEKGAPPGRVPAASVDGDMIVPPGQTRQIDVTFALPSSVWPSDVPGYRVAWSVVGSRVHSRKTPFLRMVDTRALDTWYPYYGYYAPGYYYPGFYGSWAFRYRYGWPPPWRIRPF